MSLICVIDLETSGLDPRECGVLEMGAVMLGSDLVPVALGEFSAEVRLEEWHDWTEGAFAVHGIPREVASGEDRWSEGSALSELIFWMMSHGKGRRVTLAGMNLAGFDVQFLREMARRNGLESEWLKVASHRTIDIHALAAGIGLAGGLNLAGLYTDGICQMLGMEAEPKPHAALTGARMEAEALRRLVEIINQGVNPGQINAGRFFAPAGSQKEGAAV